MILVGKAFCRLPNQFHALKEGPREVGEFLKSETFQTIVERTRAENNPREYETRLQRDHHGTPWPPREDQDDEREEGVR